MIAYIQEIISAWDKIVSNVELSGLKLVAKQKIVTSAAPDDLLIINKDSQ